MEAAVPKFPVETKAVATTVNQQTTEIVVSKFSDKILVIITQFGKVGNLIEIRRDIAQKDDLSTSVFNIKFLLGSDDEVVHVAARFLMNYIPAGQTVVLGLALKDYQPATLRQIGEEIKKHPCFFTN